VKHVQRLSLAQLEALAVEMAALGATRGKTGVVVVKRLKGTMREQAKVSKRLYSIPEAATYLGRSAWSVRHLVWAGELPEVRVGRRVHLDVLDMDEFINKHKVTEQP